MVPTGMLDDWRVWASVGDLGFDFPSDSGTQTDAVVDVLTRARSAIEAHGDVRETDLVGWSVLDGHEVSGGFLRTDVLPVAALIDVISGFEALLAGTLEPEPTGSTWMFGHPMGRTDD